MFGSNKSGNGADRPSMPGEEKPPSLLPPTRAFAVRRVVIDATAGKGGLGSLETVTVQAHEITVVPSGALCFVEYKLDEDGDITRHWPAGFNSWFDYVELSPSKIVH